MNKYIFPIIKWKIKPWLKYYILNKSATSYPLSEITTGTSPLTLSNSVRKKFNIFNIGGNTIQNGTPTPETPVPVENVSGEVEVKVANGTDSTAQGYQEQTTTLSLPEGMEMCKIGDYKDSFVYQGGKWYKNKVFQKVIFDGTENWRGSNSTWHRYYIEISDVLKQGQILSDYFIRDIELQDHNKELYGKIDTGYWHDGLIFIQDYKAFTTLAEFKTWLSSHNTTVYYQLKEPVLEEITDLTLISDLESLKNLYSYKGTTHISSTNEPSPIFEVQYYMEEGEV